LLWLPADRQVEKQNYLRGLLALSDTSNDLRMHGNHKVLLSFQVPTLQAVSVWV
jgi:hypothetical protein